MEGNFKYTLNKEDDSIKYFSRIVWDICLENYVDNFEDYLEIEEIEELTEDELSNLIIENGVDFYGEAHIMIRECPEDFINDNINELNKVIINQLNDLVPKDINSWNPEQKNYFINQLFNCVVNWCETNISDFSKKCAKEILSSLD